MTHLKVVVQRVRDAEVIIHGRSQGKLPLGLLVFLGVGGETCQDDVIQKLCSKLLSLRIFEDAQGKMNLNVGDAGGGLYVVSQFTLFANLKSGNRPSFTEAAAPHLARQVYDKFLNVLKKEMGESRVLSGQFGAEMAVSFVNQGPVTVSFDFDENGVK